VDLTEVLALGREHGLVEREQRPAQGVVDGSHQTPFLAVASQQDSSLAGGTARRRIVR